MLTVGNRQDRPPDSLQAGGPVVREHHGVAGQPRDGLIAEFPWPWLQVFGLITRRSR